METSQQPRLQAAGYTTPTARWPRNDISEFSAPCHPSTLWRHFCDWVWSPLLLQPPETLWHWDWVRWHRNKHCDTWWQDGIKKKHTHQTPLRRRPALPLPWPKPKPRLVLGRRLSGWRNRCICFYNNKMALLTAWHSNYEKLNWSHLQSQHW